MATGHDLLAGIYGVNADTTLALMSNVLVGGFTQPQVTIRGTMTALNVGYLSLDGNRLDAALALEYGDANSQSFPPAEEDRTERFQVFWGYTRGELETLVEDGTYPEI